MQRLKQKFLDSLPAFYSEREIVSLFFQSVQKVTGYSKSGLLANPDFTFSAEQETELNTILTRLQAMEPIQYIFGECEFYGLSFSVNPSVLIPRPETEELVAWIISDHANQSGNLLDIGTGSGCIAVSLAHFLKSFSVFSVDISDAALTVAEENAERNNCHVQFTQVDILKPENVFEDDAFDVIVSNPPYVREKEKQQMSNNVLEYEPHLALFVPDDDPLVFYKAIALFGKKRLKEGGKLYLEINEGLGKDTVTLLSLLGYRDIVLRKDIFGRDRMIRASLPPAPSEGGGVESSPKSKLTGKEDKPNANFGDRTDNSMRSTPPPSEGVGGRLLSRAARSCSLSEKCEQDVRKKLTEWQLPIENMEKVIAYLKEEKYLNEMRFAEFFVRDKHRFGKWGKTKIIFALKSKGISPDMIDEAIKNIDFEDYEEQLKSLLASKFKSIKYKDKYDAKAKLYRFGMSRGFENELVLKTIDAIII